VSGFEVPTPSGSMRLAPAESPHGPCLACGSRPGLVGLEIRNGGADPAELRLCGGCVAGALGTLLAAHVRAATGEAIEGHRPCRCYLGGADPRLPGLRCVRSRHCAERLAVAGEPVRDADALRGE
jgi:hypothetical protein